MIARMHSKKAAEALHQTWLFLIIMQPGGMEILVNIQIRGGHIVFARISADVVFNTLKTTTRRQRAKMAAIGTASSTSTPHAATPLDSGLIALQSSA